MIYHLDHTKKLHFYRISINRKSNTGSDLYYLIEHQNGKAKKLCSEDFISKKDDVLDQKNADVSLYSVPSQSSIDNKLLEVCGKNQFQSFIRKTKINLRYICFEVALNENNQIFQLDTFNIYIDHKNEGVTSQANLKYNLKTPNINSGYVEHKEYKCDGNYCSLQEAYQKSLIDDKLEENNIYLMRSNPKQRWSIAYKSILLDIVERIKTIELIKKACPLQTEKQIHQMNEGLLLKFRKYYYASELKTDKLFEHLSIANLFEVKKVCGYCHAMYNRLDQTRVDVLFFQKI